MQRASATSERRIASGGIRPLTIVPIPVRRCPFTARTTTATKRGTMKSVAMKGKWAQGIRPRNFSWIIKDQLAICERPGGYGANHRKVRRQEEIIWIREQEFSCVISLIPAPHNLHNYDELNLPYRHWPFPTDEPAALPGHGATPRSRTCSRTGRSCSSTARSSATASAVPWPATCSGTA